MSTPLKPPPRLVDDVGTSSLVRGDLENVAGAAPGYDAAAGLVALQAALGAGTKVAAGASASSTTVASAGKSALGAKLAVAGSVSAVAIAGAVMMLQPAPKHGAPTPKPRAAKVLEPPAVNVEPAMVAPPAPSSIPDVVKEPSFAPRDRAAAEIAQLAQIKAAVKLNPSRALRLAEQGHRSFGDGYLHHEREGLAIVALHALGRGREAHARAERFLARYPHGSLSERVRALEVEAGER